jgi:hypothetical protein
MVDSLPALAFSLLFCFQGANSSRYVPKGSDTDTRKCVNAFEGRVAMLTVRQSQSQHGFQKIFGGVFCG